MDTIQIPLDLIQRMEKEISPDESLNQIVTEAIQMWLDRRYMQKYEKEKVIEDLRKSGLAMSKEAQKAFVESLGPINKEIDRSQVEASLSKLKISLSAEIINMRGDI